MKKALIFLIIIILLASAAIVLSHSKMTTNPFEYYGEVHYPNSDNVPPTREQLEKMIHTSEKKSKVSLEGYTLYAPAHIENAGKLTRILLLKNTLKNRIGMTYYFDDNNPKTSSACDYTYVSIGISYNKLTESVQGGGAIDVMDELVINDVIIYFGIETIEKTGTTYARVTYQIGESEICSITVDFENLKVSEEELAKEMFERFKCVPLSELE